MAAYPSKGSALQGCYTLAIGKQLMTCCRIVVPLSSWLRSPSRVPSMILWSVTNCLPVKNIITSQKSWRVSIITLRTSNLTKENIPGSMCQYFKYIGFVVIVCIRVNTRMFPHYRYNCNSACNWEVWQKEHNGSSVHNFHNLHLLSLHLYW